MGKVALFLPISPPLRPANHLICKKQAAAPTSGGGLQVQMFSFNSRGPSGLATHLPLHHQLTLVDLFDCRLYLFSYALR